jgi:hypothetical protein
MSSYTFDTTLGKRVAFRMLALFVCPLVALFAGVLALTVMGPAALIVVIAAGFYSAFGLARLLKIDSRERAVLSVSSATIACAQAVGLAVWVITHIEFG